MLGERIKIARTRLKLSQTDVGKKIGRSKTAVLKWEKGENTPKDIDLLAKILKVNVNWLRFNKGPMEPEGVLIHDINKKEIYDWDANTKIRKDEIEVPFFSSMELAIGYENMVMEDCTENKLRFAKSFLDRRGVDKNHVICFPAKGNSMEPVIPNGATVAVDTKEKSIKDGSVYVICQDGLCRLKRLYLLPNNQIRIVSYNSTEYPDETDLIKNIQIIGKVFHCSFELN